MLHYLVIAIFALALAAKVTEIIFTVKLALARKNNKKSSHKKPTKNSNVYYSKPRTSSGVKQSGSTQKVHSTTRSANRYTPSRERSYDFVPDTMASSAHEDAVRMHNEAMDIAQRQQNFAHEEAVRMNDWNNFSNDIFMHETAVHDHEFMHENAHFDSLGMHDIAINDSSFLNDMAMNSFDMGCGGFGMF